MTHIYHPKTLPGIPVRTQLRWIIRAWMFTAIICAGAFCSKPLLAAGQEWRATCTLPTTRQNGDPIEAAEIETIQFDLDGVISDQPTCDFVFTVGTGNHQISVNVVDVWGLESGFTSPLVFTVSPTSPPGMAIDLILTPTGN